MTDLVYDAEFSPNGKWVVTASTDGTARIWDAATGNGSPTRCSTERRSTAPPSARMAPGGDSSRMTIPRECGTQRRARPSANRFSTATRPERGVRPAWGPGSDRFRGQDRAGVECKSYGKELQHNDRVLWAAFSPDGSRVVTASADMSAQVWGRSYGRPHRPTPSAFWPRL